MLSNWGVIPLILADSRPDYVHTIRSLGGQVITFSPGHGHINPLDLGPMVHRLHQIKDASARQVALDEMTSRRLSLMKGLVGMMLGQPLAPHEASVLALAVQMLDPELQNPPLIPQLTAFIQSAPEELRAVALTYEDVDAYNCLLYTSPSPRDS